MPSNRELLELEFDTLWLKDERGRMLGPQGGGPRTTPHLVIGAADDGWVLAFGDGLPDAVVDEIAALFADEPPASDLAQVPAPFARCKELLARAVGSVDPRDGPTYVVPSGVSFQSDAPILRSDAGVAPGLRSQDFERINWTAEEWRELLDGKLGAWAFVVDGDRVVSMCHSARFTKRGAEAGTWTDPDYRGRGYAAAATAAWAEMVTESGRVAFYGTWAANLSSQRVAERLGLPLIGWTWTLSSHEPEAIAT